MFIQNTAIIKEGIFLEELSVLKRENCFYTPIEDRTYYAITRGGQAASPILCPEHNSKTMLATVMKLHGWIDLIKAESSA